MSHLQEQFSSLLLHMKSVPDHFSEKKDKHPSQWPEIAMT